jgi:predicted secreted Zn-dependent protease
MVGMLGRASWLVVASLFSVGCGGSQVSPVTRALLPHSEPPQVEELKISRRSEPYPVSGRTVAELSRSMRAHASANWPDPQAVGMTVSSIPVAGRCQEYSDGGGLRDATISLSLVVHLPDWQEREQAPAALRKSWDRFLTALTAHEEGHVEISIEHATKLRNELAALTPEASCQELTAKFQDRANAAQARMDRAQEDYDEKTQHGIKQGCVL